ncbi:MAG: hypothetical protein M1347_02715 [Chloroflexi bacterium]|nr:hypothetical protein [Chloroflexota bacterium]
MSFRNLIFALTFLAIFAMGLRFSMDTDTWWHLRTGEVILQQRTIPTTDSFSFTRDGEPWRYPSTAWLMELKLYFIYSWFGPGGLNIWVAATITLAFAFIYLSMSGGAFLRAFVLVLATAVSGVYWAARPYMATFVLSAIFIWILEDFRWGRKRRLIWLPVLMAIWVNSHPGFAMGFILVGIYFVDELVRWLAANWPLRRKKFNAAIRGRLGAFVLVSFALLVAASLNPSGLTIFGYPFETVSIGVLRDFIEEWQSPNFHEPGTQPFIWLLLLTLGALSASRKRVALSDFLLMTAAVYLTLLAGRNMPLFALVAPIVLTRYAAPSIEELRKKLRWKPSRTKAARWQKALNVAILLVLVLAVAARARVFYPDKANREDYAGDFPIGAVEYIKEEQPYGNLFNSYNWGGYLIWNLRDYPVYVDGRTDLYSDGVLREWLNTVNINSVGLGALDRWGIRLVLIEPEWPLAKILPDEGWQLLYEDKISVLYGR